MLLITVQVCHNAMSRTDRAACQWRLERVEMAIAAVNVAEVALVISWLLLFNIYCELPEAEMQQTASHHRALNRRAQKSTAHVKRFYFVKYCLLSTTQVLSDFVQAPDARHRPKRWYQMSATSATPSPAREMLRPKQRPNVPWTQRGVSKS